VMAILRGVGWRVKQEKCCRDELVNRNWVERIAGESKLFCGVSNSLFCEPTIQ
jgi:hypothetical protein